MELEALAAAALQGAAEFCRELAEVAAGRRGRGPPAQGRCAGPPPDRGGRRRRGPAPRCRARRRGRRPAPRPARLPARDHRRRGVLLAVRGRAPRPRLAARAGAALLRAADGEQVCAVPPAFPSSPCAISCGRRRIVSAARRGAASSRCQLARAGPGRAGGRSSSISPRGAVSVRRPRARVPAARPGARLRRGRARARPPGPGAEPAAGRERVPRRPRGLRRRAAGAGRGAGGRRPRRGARVGRGRARASRPARAARPLGPGRLRRLSFRRVFALEVGRAGRRRDPRVGGLLVVAGAEAVAAVERASGRLVWRAPGAAVATALPRAVLLSRGGVLTALEPRGGRVAWERPLPGEGPPARWRSPAARSC